MAILKATFNVKKDIGYDELSVASRGVDVAYDNTTSGLSAIETQSAINELSTEKQDKVVNVSDTEIGYLDGVTSSIQTQINGKQATITGGATTVTSSNLSANRALVSDANGKISVSTITSTILGYLANVTSDIQTQLNNKIKTVEYDFGTLTPNETKSLNLTSLGINYTKLINVVLIYSNIENVYNSSYKTAKVITNMDNILYVTSDDNANIILSVRLFYYS